MSRKIFVNLPVKDLSKSVDFFTQLGFEFDPNFTDESATCMIISDEALPCSSKITSRLHQETSATRRRTRRSSSRCPPTAKSRSRIWSTRLWQPGVSWRMTPMDHGFMYGWSFQNLHGPWIRAHSGTASTGPNQTVIPTYVRRPPNSCLRRPAYQRRQVQTGDHPLPKTLRRP
jgi:predicted lactoylglutathione lyase